MPDLVGVAFEKAQTSSSYVRGCILISAYTTINNPCVYIYMYIYVYVYVYIWVSTLYIIIYIYNYIFMSAHVCILYIYYPSINYTVVTHSLPQVKINFQMLISRIS